MYVMKVLIDVVFSLLASGCVTQSLSLYLSVPPLGFGKVQSLDLKTILIQHQFSQIMSSQTLFPNKITF